MFRFSRIASIWLALWTAGCAHFPVNPPLEHWEPEARVGAGVEETGRSDDIIVILAFSGGGTRAAAFSYGVLEELASTEVHVGGERRRLLDEVDLISGVSGGSFTAAYYGLHGDRIFVDFEERFLKRNLQRSLVWRILSPRNWFRFLSTNFSRSDVAAEFYDETIFDGATFADFAAGSGPAILINATDLLRGTGFLFAQGQFDYLCSDLSRFSVARAVAASSAVPGPLTPIRLHSYAGSCGFEAPAWIEEALEGRDRSPRRFIQARIAKSYLDPDRRYVHLIDGAISDNLGIRGVFEQVVQQGSLDRVLRKAGFSRIPHILMILVNAETEPDLKLDHESFAPSLGFMLSAAMGIQIKRFNFETIELVRGSFENWASELSTEDHPVAFRLIEVSFDAVWDEEERRYFNNLPTNFHLEEEAVDRLREAGRRLLRGSPAFREVLDQLRPPTSRAEP